MVRDLSSDGGDRVRGESWAMVGITGEGRGVRVKVQVGRDRSYGVRVKVRFKSRGLI